VPIVSATRLVRSNAAHRVYNPAWSDAENTRVFGKCNNPNWHGHNYTLEITVEGTPDPDTGYTYDLGALKTLAWRELVDHLDHKNLNLDVPFLKGIIPTTENLVVACWKVLAPKIAPARLVRLKLWETENHYVEYDGR
jgi:6-pyruvoyltetrahydropterin/6-carboxytetrahydropterin synthase